MSGFFWFTRIFCLVMFAVGAPFYFGYGMPDFAQLKWYDVIQLLLATASLAALLLAWRWQLLAAFILSGSAVLTSLISLAAGFGPITPLNFCLAPGLLLFLFVRRRKKWRHRWA